MADDYHGLHYNLHRYYDPDIGSYLTPDPLGLSAQPNDHAYTSNPLTLTDPLGLMCPAAGGSDTAPSPVPGNIVYRNLRPDKDPLNGLVAKNPEATYTPAGHILNGSRAGWASQYISTTRSLDVALGEQWRSGRVVAIDLDKFSGEVFDLSTDAGRAAHGVRGFTAINRTKSSMEVLLTGKVPPEAMTWVLGGP